MFVDRNGNGRVTGVYFLAQHEGQEELPDDHADVVAYNNPPPVMVTAAQIIRALDESNLLVDVDAAVALADPMTQRLWARSANFARNDPMLLAIATALGKTSEELDDLFRLAATK